MQSILAVAFGRQTELHSSQGSKDSLLKSARTFFDAQRTDSGAPDIFTLVALKCKYKIDLLVCIMSHEVSIHIKKKESTLCQSVVCSV